VTGLIAGSILLIVASAVALVLGWIGSNEALIWTSVAASVGAAICLALAYYQSRTRPVRPNAPVRPGPPPPR
jgi:hypothetical protein